MMKVRNLGRKSLEEVINKLAMMGLSWPAKKTTDHPYAHAQNALTTYRSRRKNQMPRNS